MFQIDIDPDLRLATITLSGMMPAAEVADYIVAIRRAFMQHRLRPGYGMIIDISNCPIQMQSAIESMREHIAAMPKAGAIGIVTGSSIARMQVRRLFVQPYARITSTFAAAREWVLNGVEPKP